MTSKVLTSIDYMYNYHVLHWLTKLLRPKTYLEVGVREGGSLSCVVAEEPEVIPFVLRCLKDGRSRATPEIVEQLKERFSDHDPTMMLYLFDNWSYIGGTGAHSRVSHLLEEGFSHSRYEIHEGDSRETLPSFLTEHPDKLDLMFIDGDHTVEGAWRDLNNATGHFKTLVFHDLYHPQHSYLFDLFKQYVVSHDYPYMVFGRKTGGVGVAFDLS